MAIKQNIFVTVDAIVFRQQNGQRTHLLLVERKNEPYKGCWSFPGGFVEEDEDLPDACARELEEETGLSIEGDMLKQLGAFGKPGRDPRGRTVAVAFVGEIEGNMPVKGADDAAKAKWWPLDKLPKLAFDHEEMLREVL